MARTASFEPNFDKNRKTSPWKVEIPPKYSENGSRQQRFFKTKKLAEGDIQRLKVRKENHGTAAKLLNPADEQQAASVFKLIREKGITAQLSEIAGEYIERWEQRNASVTLTHAFDEYLEKLTSDKVSIAHYKSIANIKDKFAPLGEKLVADLTHGDIERGLEGLSPSYRDAILVRLRSVLNYGTVGHKSAGKRKWLTKNPANEVECISTTEREKEVYIYTLTAINAIFSSTVTNYPELLPAIAIMTFAGVRPDHEEGEIVKLKWENLFLDDEEKRIVLPKEITKTGKRRTVTIRPALESWLNFHKAREDSMEGTIAPYKGQKLRDALREIYSTAGVTRIQDGLRHSFGSYLAKSEGLDKTEQELGHIGSRAMLNKHYREDVSDAAAREFWAIRAPRIEKA